MYTALHDAVAALASFRMIGDGSVLISGVAYDSRKTRPGDLFVCVRGFVHDGHDYAAEAVAKGARALVVERELPLNVPQVIVEDSRTAMGEIASVIYGRPSDGLRMIGVTGTNGKTTTAYLIRSMLEAAGIRSGLIGTIEQWTGKTKSPASRTTPESVDIQRLLAEMIASGCKACVMEVSSHALALGRTAGTRFDTAVFTNITQDHFDFHGGFEDYLRAKRRLFESLGRTPGKGPKSVKAAVVNGDDPSAAEFIRATQAPVITYGLGEANDVRAEALDVRGDGLAYVAHTPAGSLPVSLRLTGRFNVYNSLAALAVAYAEGIDLGRVVAGIAGTVVPGRFEPVDVGQDFTVIVDYAHTPDSLANVLETAKSLARGRVICVFGAGGDRDRGKRPQMGQVAAALADQIIVTSDNPRSEEPARICADIVAGINGSRLGAVEVIEDRREAIRRAVALAEPGDLVLIAGKGHEDYQEFKDRVIRFDDREEAAAAVREREIHGAH